MYLQSSAMGRPTILPGTLGTVIVCGRKFWSAWVGSSIASGRLIGFRNRSVEQSRLLEAATDAIQHPTQVLAKPEKTPSTETFEKFEEVAEEKPFEFSPYKAADIQSLCQQYLPHDFKGMVKAVLEVEAPLSEELFLRRIVWLFGREKVTKVVWQDYEQKMYGCQRCGIIRRNGFLYLENGQEIQFRGAGRY